MIKLIFIFTILFALDNLLVIFLPLQPIVGQYIIIPNVFLTCLCIFAFFDKKNKAFILALVFGIFYDLYYTNLIGLHVALFPLLVMTLKKWIVPNTPINFLSMFYITSVAIIIGEWFHYFMVVTIMDIQMTFFHFAQYILFISVLFNAILLIPLYPLLTKAFKKYSAKLE